MKKIVFTEEEVKIIEKAKNIFENKWWNEATTGTEEYELIRNAFFAIDNIATEINSDGVLDI